VAISPTTSSPLKERSPRQATRWLVMTNFNRIIE
jgi:hypothetical protein